jgi:hypothetical protein
LINYFINNLAPNKLTTCVGSTSNGTYLVNIAFYSTENESVNSHDCLGGIDWRFGVCGMSKTDADVAKRAATRKW